MLAEYLRPINDINDKSIHDLLTRAIKGEFELYALIKRDLFIFYDYFEFHTCPNTGSEQLSVEEMVEKYSYSRGDVVTLPTDAIKSLWIDKKLQNHSLASVFPPPSEDHKHNDLSKIDIIELEDVYVDTRKIVNPTSKKSTRAKLPHIQAINAAIDYLGTDATNAEIYEWIKKETEKSNHTSNSFLNYLDFEGEDINPFTVTNQQVTILESKSKPFSKQAFQDACAKIKKIKNKK